MPSSRSFRGVRVIRFGEFELDIRAAELRRGGVRIRLQEQPFRILVMLLEHPGEVVLREDIRRRLWPNDTVVEVGHGINAAVQRLREALGDSAESPRYVETVARRGYRFAGQVAGQVEGLHRAEQEPAFAVAAAALAPVQGSVSAPVTPGDPGFDSGDLGGKTVSHFQVLEKLGGGGMGVVYRAQDLKLGRHVALKFLPAELACDPVALSRFEREARAASALNHPNICTIYGVEECSGQPVIVMEFLQGETLEARLVKGPLPPGEALALAIQMAAALDAAHRKGVVHRDLKPANVLLTESGLKVLDFGLAKMDFGLAKSDRALGGVLALITPHLKPYVTPYVTQEGAILGTLHYMSPEQLQGKEAGAASDIYSFGVVLYEMLAGRRAYAAPNTALVIAAILTAPPPELPSTEVPAALNRVLRRCLAKDPEERWQTARDLKAALELAVQAPANWATRPELAAAPPAAAAPVRPVRRPSRRTWITAGAAGAALCAVLLVAPAGWRENPLGRQPTRVTVTAPGGAGIARLNLSPDGRRIAFVSANRIFVRALNSQETLPLEGTEGAGTPFWSPDGRFLAFPAGGKLKVTEAAGGPPRVLCEVNTNIAGAWGSDGTIVIGLVGDGLFRIPAAGGRLTRITELDRARGESRHLAPQFLPGSRKLLFVAGAVKAGESMLDAGSLDSSERVPIMPVETNVAFVPAGNATWGYLVFGRAGMLLAQRFDVEKLRAEGEAFPILDSVRGNPAVGSAVKLADFSIAGGALAYRPGSAVALAQNLQPASNLNLNAIYVIQNWMAGLKR